MTQEAQVIGVVAVERLMLRPDAVDELDEALAADAEPAADVAEVVETEVASGVEGPRQIDESTLIGDIPEGGLLCG